MTHARIHRFGRALTAPLLLSSFSILACAAGDVSRGLEGGDGLPTWGPEDESEATSVASLGFEGDEGSDPLLDLGMGQDDPPCESELYAWEPVRPQLVFVLDHSGSMVASMPDPLGESWTRWAALHEVVSLTLERREDEVEFGLKVFPTPALADEDHCAVAPEVEFMPAPMAMEGVLAAMPAEDSQPVGATPIHAGLKAAGTALEELDPTRPRAMVLVADGGISSSCGSEENAADASAYLEELRASSGIETFVVAVGALASTAPSLEALSVAGGLGYVFASQDSLELDAAIETIVDGVRSCEVQLAEPFPLPGALIPRVDGVELVEGESCETGVGFVYEANLGRLTLCELACEAYFDGAPVEVENDCQPD